MDIRNLRLRMGWTPSDLARRLGVHASEIEIWEHGSEPQDSAVLGQLELLFHQADECCQEVRQSALAEAVLDQDSLDQISNDHLPQN